MYRLAAILLLLLPTGMLFAQVDGHDLINDQSDYEGIWIVVDSNSYIRPLCDNSDEDCEMAPGGDKLIMGDASTYFSSYIHPTLGASINLEFSYERNGSEFNCIMTSSNELGYWMQHENQPFSFQLYHSQKGGTLLIILDDGTKHLLREATINELK
jgi:hypothetical protein